MDIKINENLKQYINDNILPEYELNDGGHNLRHINIVLERAFELAENYDIDYDMLYCIVCFHDITCHINREIHEKLSAERLSNDNNLRAWFDEKQMLIMKEAVEDHRASLDYEPRSIYGKILSSADRKYIVDDYFVSSLGYTFKKYPDFTEDEVINDSYRHAIEKFGKNGYAVQKFYIPDKKYKAFLDDLQRLIDNKEEFVAKAKLILKQIREGKNNGWVS